MEGHKEVALECPKCHNTTGHVVCAFPDGVCVGLPFLRKPWWSLKKFFLICPVCHNPTKQLTKSEAAKLGPKL